MFAWRSLDSFDYNNPVGRVSNLRRKEGSDDRGPPALLQSRAMDYLWSPWRYAYITGAEPKPKREPGPPWQPKRN